MSELDKKLEEIYGVFFINSRHMLDKDRLQRHTDLIKQAFIDAGWINSRDYSMEDVKGRSVPFEVLANALGLMTALEWEKQAIENHNSYAASKKAAGIEQ